MSKCYKNMELEKLIKNGLKYIGLKDNLENIEESFRIKMLA